MCTLIDEKTILKEILHSVFNYYYCETFALSPSLFYSRELNYFPEFSLKGFTDSSDRCKTIGSADLLNHSKTGPN